MICCKVINWSMMIFSSLCEHIFQLQLHYSYIGLYAYQKCYHLSHNQIFCEPWHPSQYSSPTSYRAKNCPRQCICLCKMIIQTTISYNFALEINLGTRRERPALRFARSGSISITWFKTMKHRYTKS